MPQYTLYTSINFPQYTRKSWQRFSDKQSSDNVFNNSKKGEGVNRLLCAVAVVNFVNCALQKNTCRFKRQMSTKGRGGAEEKSQNKRGNIAYGIPESGNGWGRDREKYF